VEDFKSAAIRAVEAGDALAVPTANMRHVAISIPYKHDARLRIVFSFSSSWMQALQQPFKTPCSQMA
jgi:hypothetical protein